MMMSEAKRERPWSQVGRGAGPLTAARTMGSSAVPAACSSDATTVAGALAGGEVDFRFFFFFGLTGRLSSPPSQRQG